MAEKKDYDRLRQTAEDLFVRNDMTARQIADLLQISEVTISKWRQGRGEKPISWDDQKAELNLSPTQLKMTLIKEAKNIAEGNDSKIDADSLSKIMSAIDKLDKKISLRIIADVFKYFDTWMADVDPATAIQFTHYQMLYLQHCIKTEIN